MWARVSWWVEVCRSVLQCVAVCCVVCLFLRQCHLWREVRLEFARWMWTRVLTWGFAVCYSALFSVLQCAHWTLKRSSAKFRAQADSSKSGVLTWGAAACCSVLQRVAACCSLFQWGASRHVKKWSLDMRSIVHSQSRELTRLWSQHQSTMQDACVIAIQFYVTVWRGSGGGGGCSWKHEERVREARRKNSNSFSSVNICWVEGAQTGPTKITVHYQFRLFYSRAAIIECRGICPQHGTVRRPHQQAEADPRRAQSHTHAARYVV